MLFKPLGVQHMFRVDEKKNAQERFSNGPFIHPHYYTKSLYVAIAVYTSDLFWKVFDFVLCTFLGEAHYVHLMWWNSVKSACSVCTQLH